MNTQPAETKHIEFVEVFKSQPAAVRGRLLYKARYLAGSPSQLPHTREFNAVLVREFERAEKEIMQTAEKPPEIPVLTWGMAVRIVAPVLKVGAILTVGGYCLYFIGAIVVGLAKGAHDFAVASGGWVFGAACVCVLYWVGSKIEWRKKDEPASGEPEQNQQIIVNVFASQNGDVSVNKD